MGKVLKPVGAMFGIGQQDDPTFQPGQANTAAYTKFSQENPDSIDGIKGTRMASDEIRSNPLTSGLYGAGGLQDRLGTEEQDLASRGYSLQQPDYEAYGQASGHITRQFGQQEADTAKALSRRGLGGTSSGAAGAAFSGLAGSKNEMLAKAQTDIAQKRMADTTQRLQATRQMMSTLGNQASNDLQAQYGRQLAGRQERGDELKTAMNGEQNINTQNRQANEDAIGHKSKNIGDAWAEGKYSGTKSGEADATASWMKMGGSSSMGMSDENSKTNIRDGGGQARGFLSQIANSHDYGYQPAKAPGGEEKASASGLPLWAQAIRRPNKDGTYTPTAKENANMQRASGGLMDHEDGSGGMVTPTKTLDANFSKGGGGDSGAANSLFGSLGGQSGAQPELMSMLSDENDKQNIHDGGSKVRSLLDSIEPHSYEYKEQYKHGLGGPGHYVSPMAQELEQTDLGKDMVHDTPDGKVVDYGKGFGTLLAGMADVNKRLSAIEGRK